ncbi:MAG: hypothetical protein KGQ79_00855 [Proteobacteria bacterium]|nr:hypothetical protein [Pseudomonadota bacterium]
MLSGTTLSPDHFEEPGHPALRLVQTRVTRLRAARTRILLTTALTTALAGMVPHQAKAATCSTNITASCTVTQLQTLGQLSNSGSIGTLTNSGTIYSPSFAGTGTQASGYAIVNSGEIQDFNNIGTILGGGTALTMAQPEIQSNAVFVD